MLSKCRCPHTGVVNFFTKADPQLAVGSVAEAGDTTAFAWRCYVGEEAGGLAPDISLAAMRLRISRCWWHVLSARCALPKSIMRKSSNRSLMARSCRNRDLFPAAWASVS